MSENPPLVHFVCVRFLSWNGANQLLGMKNTQSLSSQDFEHLLPTITFRMLDLSPFSSYFAMLSCESSISHHWFCALCMTHSLGTHCYTMNKAFSLENIYPHHSYTKIDLVFEALSRDELAGVARHLNIPSWCILGNVRSFLTLANLNFHPTNHPQVLSLRNAFVTFVADSQCFRCCYPMWIWSSYG